MSHTPKQQFENNKLSKRLRHLVGLAINDFQMIQPGDKVMVCLSGGKDSHALLDILMGLKASSPVPFDILAVNLDQKQPGFPEKVLPEYLESIGVPYRIETRDTYSVVKRVVPEGKTTCGLCSRLRRGVLYRVAREEGVTKIALGHHRDDIVETLFLNMFYGGVLKGMAPKLLTDNREHMVIRPLCYVPEKDLERYARMREFPIIPCNLCGSQEHLQRKAVKEMLRTWNRDHPGRVESIFRSMCNVELSHLCDTSRHPFVDLDKLRNVPKESPNEKDGDALGNLARHEPRAAAGTDTNEGSRLDDELSPMAGIPFFPGMTMFASGSASVEGSPTGSTMPIGRAEKVSNGADGDCPASSASSISAKAANASASSRTNARQASENFPGRIAPARVAAGPVNILGNKNEHARSRIQGSDKPLRIRSEAAPAEQALAEEDLENRGDVPA